MGISFNPYYKLYFYRMGQVIASYDGGVNNNIDFDFNSVQDGFEDGQSRTQIKFYNMSSSFVGTIEKAILNSNQDLTSSNNDGYSSFQLKIETAYQQGSTGLKTLCYEDIVGCYTTESSAETEVEMTLMSGGDSITKNFSSSSYKQSSTAVSILTQEAAAMVDNHSVTGYYVSPDCNDKTYNYGYAHVGKSWDLIKKICHETSNICYVKNGTLYILPASKTSTARSKIWYLSSDDGLLQAPRLGQNNYSKKYTEDYSVVSYTMQSTLLPELSIGDIIVVNNYKYTVKKISHSIETRKRAEAYTIIEGLKN